MKHITDPNFREKRNHPTLLCSVIYRFIPAHVWQVLRSEIQALKVRLGHGAARRQGYGMKDVYVNLGCGPSASPGWVNVDMARYENVDLVFGR